MRKCKMRFFLLGILLVVPTLSAQNFSFYMAGGYGLPRGQDYWNSSMTYNEDHELVKEEDHYLSIGKGIPFEAGLIYSLSPKLNLRLAGVYSQMSPDLVVEQHYLSDGTVDSETYTASWVGGRADLFFTHPFKKCQLYTGVGCGLFFGTIKQMEIDEEENLPSYKYEYVYRMNPALGLNGFLGLSKSLNSRLSLFAEFYFQQMSFLVKEYEILKAERDGVSILDEIDLDWAKEGNQTVQKYTKDSVQSNSPEVIQGSSCGIKAGIRVRLGNIKTP